MDEDPFAARLAVQFPALDRKISLLCIDGADYPQAAYSVLRRFIKQLGSDGVYVSLCLPYKYLAGNLKSQRIDTTGLFFIDGVSRATGQEVKAQNCVYVDGPDSLVEISLALTDAATKGGAGFIFVDSISALAKANDEETARRFIEYTVNKAKNLGKTTVILSVRDEKNEGMQFFASRLADRTVEL